MTSDPIVLRDFAPEDLDAAYRLDQSCFEPGIAYTRGQIRSFLAREGAIAIVAEGEAGLAAFAIGHVMGARGHVVTIDIAAPERRKGLGRRLLAELTSRLAAAGARVAHLEVDRRNTDAIRFYERMGYRAVGALPDYYGPGLEGLRMNKTL